MPQSPSLVPHLTQSSLGASGLFAALVYLILRIGLSAQVTLLIQVFTPVMILVTYLFILGKPGKILPTEGQDNAGQVTAGAVHVQNDPDSDTTNLLSAAGDDKEDEDEKNLFLRSTGMREGVNKKGFHLKLFNREEVDYWLSHVKYIPKLLLPYMLPLFAVYMAEYMINQGLYELFIYPDTHLGSIEIGRSAQYRV